MKKSNKFEFFVFAFAVMALNLYPLESKADHISGDRAIPPPESAEKIVRNIRDVIVNGNLADDQYYAVKFGVVLDGKDVNSTYEPGPMCGQIKTNISGQVFNNLNAPWYFDVNHEFKNKCGAYPYKKEFLPNGLVRVDGYIFIDTLKVCITPDQIKNGFSRLDYSHGLGSQDFFYMFRGKNLIRIAMLPSENERCISMINLSQNYSENKK